MLFNTYARWITLIIFQKLEYPLRTVHCVAKWFDILFLQAGNLIYVLYARFKLNDKSLQNPVSSRLLSAIPISQTPKAHKSTFLHNCLSLLLVHILYNSKKGKHCIFANCIYPLCISFSCLPPWLLSIFLILHS